MPTFSEVRCYLTGLWLLARLDPNGFGYLDISERGAMRSFWAILWCAPATAISWIWWRAAYLRSAPLDPETGFPFFFRMGLVEAANWITPPVLAGFLCLALGLGARFLAIVIVMNWLALPFSYAYAAVVAGVILVPAAAGMASLVWLVLMIALVLVLMQLLRMICGRQPLTIATLILVLLVPSILISDALQRYLDVYPF